MTTYLTEDSSNRNRAYDDSAKRGIGSSIDRDRDDVPKKFIDMCKRHTNHKFLGRRFGTLSNNTKAEIFQLEMSMCLETHYMKCLKHVNDSRMYQTTPVSSMDICEPLIHEYMKEFSPPRLSHH